MTYLITIPRMRFALSSHLPNRDQNANARDLPFLKMAVNCAHANLSPVHTLSITTQLLARETVGIAHTHTQATPHVISGIRERCTHALAQTHTTRTRERTHVHITCARGTCEVEDAREGRTLVRAHACGTVLDPPAPLPLHGVRPAQRLHVLHHILHGPGRLYRSAVCTHPRTHALFVHTRRIHTQTCEVEDARERGPLVRAHAFVLPPAPLLLPHVARPHTGPAQRLHVLHHILDASV